MTFRGLEEASVLDSRESESVRPEKSTRTARNVSRRYAAFERSPWLWTPTQTDQALNDQHHLNLDEDTIPAVLTPESPIVKLDDFASCYINHRQRDQMLALLLTLRKPPKSTPRFPSSNLLNSIIRVYFAQESLRFDSLIHIGTFSPAKVLPQLTLAIIAAGSTLICVPAIWKMGYALQEVVRHSVADYWEQDNRNVRNLQPLQAFMIGLDIGLWSGFRRNMEIAESFAQPIVVVSSDIIGFLVPSKLLLLSDFRLLPSIFEMLLSSFAVLSSFGVSLSTYIKLTRCRCYEELGHSLLVVLSPC